MPEWDVSGSTPVRVTDVENRSYGMALSNPATAVLLGATPNYSGEPVSESSILSLSAVYRAVMLVATGLGTLPLRSYRVGASGRAELVPSWIDNPAGPDSITAFEWKERVALHLMIRGETDLLHLRNESGAIVGAWPVHPSAVAVYDDPEVRGGERYTVSLDDGSNLKLTPYGDTEADPGMTRIVVPGNRGNRGRGLLDAGTSMGIAQAAEKATARMFRDGAFIPGALTPRQGEDLSDDDAIAIRRDLDLNLSGNSGRIPLINRVLEFQPWAMTNVDAQFLENRQFQIEEVSRWTGVPPMLLMQLEKQTSWGTGVAEQGKNLGRFVFNPWCVRIAERLSRLLPQPRWAEFDLAGLETGSAADEIDLIMRQVNGGFLTLNEGRALRNLPPVPGGDELRVPSGVQLNAQLAADAAATEAGTDTTGGTDGTA